MDKRVETIKHEVEETLEDMNSKIEEIEARVHDSVDYVKQTAQETVETVREKVDVRLAVDRRPWTTLGASVAVGFLLGRVGQSNRRADRAYEVQESSQSPPLALNGYSRSLPEQRFVQALPAPESSAHPAFEESRSSHEPSAAKEFTQRTISKVKRKAPGIVDGLRSQFSGEIEALKKAAVFSATNLLREALQSKMPEFAQAFDRARDEEDDVAMSPRAGANPQTVYESKEQPNGFAAQRSSRTSQGNGHAHHDSTS